MFARMLTGAVIGIAALLVAHAQEGPSPLLRFLVPNSGVLYVAYSPDGKRLVTGGTDGRVCVWQDGHLMTAIQAHTENVFEVHYLGDGRRLISAGYDGVVRLWSIEGKLLQEFRGHTAAATSVSWKADGRILITGSDDGSVRTWSANGRQLARIDYHGTTRGVAFAP